MARKLKAEEAILLASGPREVREYLAKRAIKPGFFDAISKETEAALVSRSDRLIDLSLAEYCLHVETAAALFIKDAEDWPVRSLVLSNQALAKASLYGGFPECLFGSEEAMLSYLSTISVDEQHILFCNPSLNPGFLEAFLTLGQPWQAMKPEQRVWALYSLAENEMLRRKRSTSDYEDGLDWHLAGKPFEAAWSLIVNLEPGPEEAKHLAMLLRDLPADSYKLDGVAEAIENWRAGAEEKAKERKKNAKGRLSPNQQVRQAGARLLASRYDAAPNLYLDSDDIALRCGAYEATAKLSEPVIKAAITRDGELARVYLIRNDSLWCSSETRNPLLKLVLRGAETDEPHWEFKARERKLRKEFPDWFEGDDLDEAMGRTTNEGLDAGHVAYNAHTLRLRGLHDKLMAVEKTQQRLIWLVAATLILLVAHAWR